MRVELQRPSRRHRGEFLAAARRSRSFLRPWATPPLTPVEYDAYVSRCRKTSHDGSLVMIAGGGEIAGVINLNEIVRGSFNSAYLGYYAFVPHAGLGFMSEGLGLVLRRAFREIGLHRVEANIQPENEDSREFVRRLRFRMEGYSPRYLKIGGRWRDHERWALLAEEWRTR